jgi:putative peptidoglycan lipid II flippase
VASLLKNNVVVATGTALSRITGLARSVVFAIIIGQTALSDAYNSANNSPNAVYELLLGGVLSASLVPLFTKQAEDRDDEATSAVVSVAVIALTGITVLAVLAAPLVFRLFSLGVAAGIDPVVYRGAGTALARIFLVQIFFYGLNALATALLQARRRYFAAAWAPVLSNVAIITSLLAVPSAVHGRQPQLADVLTNGRLRWTLGLGATLGIAVMALAVLPALRAADMELRFRPNLRHPAVRQLTKLSTWTLGYVVANQLAVVAVQNLADPGSGRVNAYATAYIFFVLPHGLLAMSIVTTFTPELARSVKRRDKPAFVERSSLGIRLVALLCVPAAVGMFVLRRPLIGFALQHGKFDATAALTTSRALGGFALGLIGFSLYLFTLRTFYAHGDAKTPFVINLFENAINIVLAALLVHRFGVLGLSASFAIAYLVSGLWAMQVLSYKVPGFPLRDTLEALARMLLAGLVMAEVTWLVARQVGGNVGLAALVRTVAGGVVGIAAYVAVLLVLRAPELDQLSSRVLRRRPPAT